jgi:hypothetical protein
MDIFLYLYIQIINGPSWKPVFKKSKKYKNWIAILDTQTCPECRIMHGKIWLSEESVSKEPPEHFLCRCKIKTMEAVKSGTATINGIDGADWTLKNKSELPNYYVDKFEAIQRGWKRGKWPSNFIPEKMIFGGQYDNDNGHLPQAEGRIWYEADINYKEGKRNTQRIVWSNDGLIFVTYDHYATFYEIV